VARPLVAAGIIVKRSQIRELKRRGVTVRSQILPLGRKAPAAARNAERPRR
jgi:hypothetical protein